MWKQGTLRHCVGPGVQVAKDASTKGMLACREELCPETEMSELLPVRGLRAETSLSELAELAGLLAEACARLRDGPRFVDDDLPETRLNGEHGLPLGDLIDVRPSALMGVDEGGRA